MNSIKVCSTRGGVDIAREEACSFKRPEDAKTRENGKSSEKFPESRRDVKGNIAKESENETIIFLRRLQRWRIMHEAERGLRAGESGRGRSKEG